MESRCECGMELPGFISYGDRYIDLSQIYLNTKISNIFGRMGNINKGRGNTRNWVNSAQDRDWKAVVNVALNLGVP